jgi:hypothetical protein
MMLSQVSNLTLAMLQLDGRCTDSGPRHYGRYHVHSVGELNHGAGQE